MKRTQIYLNKEQELILKNLSRERGQSVAELIRQAIDLTYRQGMVAELSIAMLARSAGAWEHDTPAGEDYVEEMRHGARWNLRLNTLMEQS